MGAPQAHLLRGSLKLSSTRSTTQARTARKGCHRVRSAEHAVRAIRTVTHHCRPHEKGPSKMWQSPRARAPCLHGPFAASSPGRPTYRIGSMQPHERHVIDTLSDKLRTASTRAQFTPFPSPFVRASCRAKPCSEPQSWSSYRPETVRRSSSTGRPRYGSASGARGDSVGPRSRGARTLPVVHRPSRTGPR